MAGCSPDGASPASSPRSPLPQLATGIGFDGVYRFLVVAALSWASVGTYAWLAASHE